MNMPWSPFPRREFAMKSVIKSKIGGRSERHFAPDFRIKIYLMTQGAAVVSKFLNFDTPRAAMSAQD